MSNPWDAEVNVGKYTSIAHGCKVITASHPSITHNTVASYPFRERHRMGDFPKCKKKGVVNIGNDVWIGDSVTIVKDLTIGDGAIVGACSVVAKDVPPYAIVAGNPIKIIRYRFTEEQIEKLLKIKWWDWEFKKIEQYIPYMQDTDINRFLDLAENGL